MFHQRISALDELPEEILLKIFSFLSRGDLSKFFLVSKRMRLIFALLFVDRIYLFFRCVASDPSLWKTIQVANKDLSSESLSAIGELHPLNVVQFRYKS